MEIIEQEKVSMPLGLEDQCDCNPEFAVICSFISRFGSLIDLQLNIEELKTSLENQETLDDSLINLHVKLLKKLRRYFVRDQWEKTLIRFAYEYSHDDGYEIETTSYLKTRPSIKLRLLRRLLDAQFECDPKFKAAVNLIEAGELRTRPAGRDVEGKTYWPCVDEQGNVRVYRDDPLKHTSWLAICKNADDLKQLIEHLDATKDNKVKGEPQPEPYNPYPELFPEYFIKEEPAQDPVTVVAKKTSKKYGKKGKGKRVKKSEALATVAEEEEEGPIVQNGTHRSTINGYIKEEQEADTQDDRPRSSSPNESIESHVKYTIDHILGKVVSSFDFIFRRPSPDTAKREAEESSVNNKKPSKSRKRTKSEKPKIEEPLPRRSSSRIQQLQQKRDEEEAIKKQVLEIAKLKSTISEKAPTKAYSNETQPKPDKKDKQRWRNHKGKKRISWDKDDSDLSSASLLSDSNDDESFMDALDETSKQGNEEDEFACEDEETNDEPVIVKRVRTARQIVNLNETSDPNESSVIEEDKPCGRCDKSNDPDWILLCDMCDDGYHTTCCVPPLMFVPDGDWFCPPCEQKMLTQKLKDICNSVVELLETIERERLKRQKLRQLAPKKEIIKSKPTHSAGDRKQRDVLNELNNPSAEDVNEHSASTSCDELPSSYRERSTRLPKKKTKTRKKIKRPRYESEDDEEEYDYEPAGRSRYKRSYSRNISDSESEEALEEDGLDGEEDFSDSSSGGDGEQLKTRRARAFVSYKFEEYDELIQSAICGDSDPDISNREERTDTATCNIGRGKDMATIEALAYQQENGLAVDELNEIKQPKQRRKGRKLNDLDAESEIDIATSDESFQASSATEDLEDEEEDELTEVSTEDDSSIDEIVSMYHSKAKRKKHKVKRKKYDYDSDDSDFKPRSRRAAAQKISYKESTDEEAGMQEDEEEEEYDPLVRDAEPEVEPVTKDPINELSQYCNESSHPSNPLFSSFKMSPPRPQFYKEDEVRSLQHDLDK